MKFLIVLSAVLAAASAGSLAPGLSVKVKAGLTHAIVDLPPVVQELEKSSSFQSLQGTERDQALVTILQGLTSATQAPIVAKIKELGLSYESFWIANTILVKDLTPEALATLAAFPGEFTIREEHTASIHPAVNHGPANISQQAQWGVEMIGAPDVWDLTDGAGTVAAIIDTGVNLGHRALAEGYAGAWADPYYNTAGPTDVHGHGSHCAGTILGRENGVGVAPGARWIACRGLNHQGSGSESGLNTCAQFMLTANPKPNVVSNSWGGGSGQTWYNQQVTAWRQAGIIPVFAIGNSGPSCGSRNSPGDQPNLISVGATTNQDQMASFSSRGPGPNNSLKPEVSAPGQNIVSCGTGANDYVTMSGTSMATPHTAGAVCLLLSANPGWGFDQVYEALTSSAAHPTLSAGDRGCGLPTPGQDFPNHAWGHGRIDVAAALRRLKN